MPVIGFLSSRSPGESAGVVAAAWPLPVHASAELEARHSAAVDYDNGKLDGVVTAWRTRRWTPVNSGELAALGESLADIGDPVAHTFAEQLRPLRPIDADAIQARLEFRNNNPAASAALLERVFIAGRKDPWPSVDLFGRALDIATILSKQRAYAGPLFRALGKPFAAGQWNDTRRYDRALVAIDMEGCGPHAVAALRALEPWTVWNEAMLKARVRCLGAKGDYEEWRASEPAPLVR